MHFVGHVSDAELIAYYELADLFLCAQRARRLLRAADRGVLQAGAGARLRGDRRAGDDGRRRACCSTTKDPAYVAALMDAILSNPDLAGRRSCRSSSTAVDRLQAKDFDGTLLGFVEQILASPRQGAPRVAFDFWQQFDCARAARGEFAALSAGAPTHAAARGAPA